MKNKSRLLLALAFGLALCLSAEANVKQVTTLTTAVATIVIPGNNAKTIIIQNNGAVAVRLTFDGGSTYTNIYTLKTGQDPTTTTGYLLAVGAQVNISTVAGDSGLHKPIRAIAASATAVLDIVTDDAETTFPTN